jgi:hypothetical protein
MRSRQSFPVVFFASLFVAVVLSVIVGAIALIAAAVIWATEGWLSLRGAIPGALAAGSVICASYFGAAILGAPIYFILQRWTDRWWGRAMAWTVLGTLVYGVVGLAAVLAYVHLDVNILDFESQGEAWGDLLPTTVVLGLVTGLVGPFVSGKFSA